MKTILTMRLQDAQTDKLKKETNYLLHKADSSRFPSDMRQQLMSIALMLFGNEKVFDFETTSK